MPSLAAAHRPGATAADGELGVWLLTLESTDLSAPQRFALASKDVTSRGLLYTASPVQFDEPGDDDGVPRAKITLPNVDREIGFALEENSNGLTAHFELVLPSNFDVVVQAWRMLDLKSVEINPLSVSGELSACSFEDEPYAALRVTQGLFPGFYR
jgi:hypothetical protein